MVRYITCFYNSNEINKFTKVVKVIEAMDFKGVLDVIHNEHKCRFIKYIRDLESNKHTIYNTELVIQEDENNFKLKKYD